MHCITSWEYRERILPRASLVLVWRTKGEYSCHVFVIVTPHSFLDISEGESLFLALSVNESVSCVDKKGRCDKWECGGLAGILVVMEIWLISHRKRKRWPTHWAENTQWIELFWRIESQWVHFCVIFCYYWNAHCFFYFI